jgi:hypothetical protein
MGIHMSHRLLAAILFLCPIASLAESTKFSSIQAELLKPDGPRTVEAFLEYLNQTQPELFAGFTMMRRSESLQGATPAAPRAIVFGKDARFVATFNGSPDQVGYQSVEMMEFVETADGGFFQMIEATFNPHNAAALPRIELNPAKCTRCHGTDPKPIWEDYDKWPGAYGEDDDALIDFDDGSRYPPTGYQDNGIVTRHRQHLQEFRQFLAAKDGHPRYRLLQFPQGTESPVAPYIPRIRTGDDPLRPNLRLTKLFSELNAKRVARKLAESGDGCFQTVAPLAASILINCGSFDQLKEDIDAARQALTADQAQFPWPAAIQPVPYSAANGDNFHRGFVQLMQTAGISDFDWSTQRGSRQWHYFQGFKDAADSVVFEIWPRLAEELNVELPPYQAIRAALYPNYYSYRSDDNGSYSSDDRVASPNYEPESVEEYYGYRVAPNVRETACRQLHSAVRKFTIANLKSHCATATQPSLGDSTVPKTIHMCLSCHDGRANAPQLPLADPQAMSQNPDLKTAVWLRINSSNPNLRMPPTRPLSVEEYRELERFLR